MKKYANVIEKAADLWINYPGKFYEKAYSTGNTLYFIPKNFLPILEGMIVGEIAYRFSNDENAIFWFPLSTLCIRYFQSRYYLIKNREHLIKLLRKDE